MFLFDFYRKLLMLICTVYALVRTAQAAARLVDRLAGRQKHKRLIRGYAAVMLLSVRIQRFWPQLLKIVFLLVVLGGILYAHRYWI
ncbi:MAG: hypothetical protein HQ546_11630 [Planctomycetes bacterium]|nr:hypothetical protein [Planctomycetota bacterium]